MSQTVLVAGSSGGIGTAVVAAASDAGYDVRGVDRVSPADAAPYARFETLDLTSDSAPEVVRSLVADAGDFWGFVYCAGEYPKVAFDAYTPELWDRVHAVNVRAAFFCAQALAPALRSGGRIVFVASGAGHVGSRDPAYSASKAGLLGVVRSLAGGVATREILVNAVVPGVIDTPMSRAMAVERRDEHVSRTALQRLGTPRDVAVAVLFLLDPANRYMTGASVDVNGGLYAR